MTRPFQLTREERKAIYRGVRKITRGEKPNVSEGDTLIVSWTRGGKWVIDRETGETADRVQKPVLWIKFEEPQEKPDGSWTVTYEIHDEREVTRLLGAGAPKGTLTPETERGYVSGGATTDHLEGVDDATLEEFGREARAKHAAEHPEETKAQEVRRLENKARRLQKEAAKKGVDLSGDLTLFNQRAREAIAGAKTETLSEGVG